MATIFRCDRCGKELKRNYFAGPPTITVNRGPMIMPQTLEVCSICIEDVVNFIVNKESGEDDI